MRYLQLLLLIPFLLSASPDNLVPWKEYIKSKEDIDSLPYLYNRSTATVPLWRSPLELQVTDSTGSFTQKLTVYADEQWVALPGQKEWPRNVVNDKGEKLVVLDNAGVPHLHLTKGEYAIAGKFHWEKQPQKLTIPQDMPLVLLQRNDETPRSVTINSGWISLNERIIATSQEKERNTIQMKLFRSLNDQVPQLIVSRLKLVVTGSVRDQDLGILLPTGSEIVALKSPIPAVVTSSGLLRAQVKAGVWEIELRSRMIEVSSAFTTTSGNEGWPTQEIWSIFEQNHLRSIAIENVDQIDPSQTDLPSEWRNAPAFLLQQGDTLKLVEKSRGDEQPTPNRFTLSRHFYLDFNGKGCTVLDNMYGEASRSSELSMQKPYTLGSAQLNGKPHLVIEGDSGIGVHVPAGSVNLQSVNRLEGHDKAVSASGWNTPVEELSGTLHLPPGWDLFHVMGVDEVEGSRLSLWSLWDLFLFLIIVVLLFKIFDIKWALVGTVGLLVLFHAPGVPRGFWLNMLITIAIVRQLSEGWWKRAGKIYYNLVLIFCGLVLFVLSIRTIREVVYPQVDHYEYMLFGEEGLIPKPMNLSSNVQSDFIPNDSLMVQRKDEVFKEKKMRKAKPKVSSMDFDYQQRSRKYSSKQLQQYKSDDVVQTGPGKPKWHWQAFELEWDGPVEAEQKMRFILMPPLLMRSVKLLAILSLLLLFYRFAVAFKGGEKAKKKMKKSPKRGAATSLVLFLVLYAGVSSVTADEYPPKYLYDSLVEEINEERAELPHCYPNCVSVEEVQMHLGDTLLTASFVIHAKEEVAFPLLKVSSDWAPESITCNGSISLAKTGGNYTILLTEGINIVTLSGVVVQNQLKLTFPAPLHNVTLDAPLWNSSGLVRKNLPGKTLQCVKREVRKEETRSTIGSQPLAKSFVRVTRSLYFGREQHIETIVERIAPVRTPLEIKVKLLENEAVLTPELKVEHDSVLLRIPANGNSVRYRSRLPMVDSLTLVAPEQYSSFEVWELSSDARYKVKTSGVLPVKNQAASDIISWQPRKGDSLQIAISKPKAVPGKTTTFEAVTLLTKAGKNSRTSTLRFEVNSSKGEPLTVTVPKGATIEKVRLAGKEQVFNQKGALLRVPLNPGKQAVEVEWKETTPISWLTKTPKVTLGCDGANVNLHYKMPQSRWVLALGGPLMGPSMLIWGMLLFFALIALLLPSFLKTPLKRYEWVLLLLGVSSVHYIGAIPVIVWFAFFAMREQYKGPRNLVYFNLVQLVLIATTLLLFLSLAVSIPVGLLSNPEMYIMGNGSDSYFYKWYSDRSTGQLPEAWIISLPLWAYRIIRLLWAVWLALTLPKWLKWGWTVLKKGGFWEKRKPFMPVPDNNQPA